MLVSLKSHCYKIFLWCNILVFWWREHFCVFFWKYHIFHDLNLSYHVLNSASITNFVDQFLTHFMPLVSYCTPWKQNKWGVWKETTAMKWIKSESKLANCRKEQLVNPCHATVFFLSPQKSFGNFSFSDIFTGYRKRPVAWNGLMSERVSQSPSRDLKVFLIPQLQNCMDLMCGCFNGWFTLRL